ncbi:hypothetical protein [Pseudobdellovibrio sp. HCB154]|uniref:hypothetical protein n=1 Tax=Pseudobdellovibrio sp. HCB154 TaxID=3386277 RepID=UPI003916CF91
MVAPKVRSRFIRATFVPSFKRKVFELACLSHDLFHALALFVAVRILYSHFLPGLNVVALIGVEGGMILSNEYFKTAIL